ncbi:MAG: hypothetical protein GY739_19240 [Mesoflavibacter sp.]|nr:hypothetical protein [Mesoflavibacter sp.]
MKAVKKPIPIEAMQITKENITNCTMFTNGDFSILNGQVTIKTLEGTMTGKINDYIIKGIKKEFYICDRTIFEESYDIVE